MSELTDLQERVKVLDIQIRHMKDQIWQLGVELTNVELERYDVLDDIAALETADTVDTVELSK